MSEPASERKGEPASKPMIDPHGDAGDVITGVPILSVDEVEKRIGAKARVRGEGVRSGAPIRGRSAAPTNRRVTLWRDSATILIFVIVALLAARFFLPGNGQATASPTPDTSGLNGSLGPGDSGFLFSLLPSLGPAVDPSSGLNASPTPIPVITLPPLAPPLAPSNAVATRGNAAADVTWDAPSFNGGTVIKNYTVTSKPGGKTCSANAGIHICTVSKLTNGVSYTFTVTATNAIGTSPASAPSNAVVPAAVPSKPTNVLASPRDGAAVVNWSKPATSGGSPISKYTVRASPGTRTCTATAPALSCKVFSLSNGTSYTFTVTATNAVGTGLPSGPSNAVIPGTPATAPGAPTSVSATAGDTTANVSWSAGSDGGSPITGYTATSSPGGLTCSTAGTGCTVSGLTNGTSYTFTVTATNAVGTSGPSAPSNSVTPSTPATVPGAPTGVTASQPGGAGTDVIVDWTDPASDGGSAITGYTVTASPGGLTCNASGAAATTCTFSAGTLAPGTYTFTVTATNGVGTGSGGSSSSFDVF